MQAQVLAPTLEMSRQQWLEVRRKGIGGSDAAAIAGLNKWKSPVAVYMEKIGEVPLIEEENESMYWGNVLEEVVAQEFSKRTGLKIRRRNAILRHSEYPFMLANVDRLIVGKREGLECKTASEYMKSEWEGDDIPTAYLLQCQHYMAVTGYEAWWIAVLVGGNKFIYKRIERDDELIDYLIQIEKNFWENHVIPRVPPKFDGSDASTKLLKAMYPESEPDSEIELDQEVDTLIDAIEQIKQELKQLEEQKNEYENRIKAKLGEFERGVVNGRTVTWKTVNSTKLDTQRLRKENPEIFEKYAKKYSYRRFQIS